MKKIEILAPAGSLESLHAGINAGADAVYIGGTSFGARAYANNLDEETLLRAIDYVHVRGKQMYLTVNTLLKEEELSEQLYKYLKPFYQEGLDAVIVQDIGVMRFIHANFPDLPIHASTQMTLTMAEGAKVLQNYGITRMVTSRELGIEEIKRIRANTSLEIESFVHGALCYSYSGQCLMSSMIGGRSGNRGRCAQPCRMEHDSREKGLKTSKKEESFLLSPKDICTLESVADFIEAGIDSFKIEGRMKRFEYTAGVVEGYRKQVDLYYELGSNRYRTYTEKNQAEIKKDILRFQDLYNRGGFHDGYYHTHNGKKMMSMQRPNHSGVYVGKVTAIKGINATILIEEPVNSQDILEIREDGNKIYEFTVKEGAEKGFYLKSNFKPGSNVSIGNEVYRTKNNQLLEELSKNYFETEKKINIRGTFKAEPGEFLEFVLSMQDESGNIVEITEYGEVAESALKQPMTEEKIRMQLEKTNETPFVFDSLNVILFGAVFIPVSKLNELRRCALLHLEESIVKKYKRSINTSFSAKGATKQQHCDLIDKPLKKSIDKYYSVECISHMDVQQDLDENKIGIISYVKNEEQLIRACAVNEVDEVYFDMAEGGFSLIEKLSIHAKNCKKKFYLVMPHIFRSYTYDLFWKNKEKLIVDTIDGYVIKNYEQYTFFSRLEQEKNAKLELRLDYNMYVINSEARNCFKDLGITHTTASVELNQGELDRIGIADMDLVVYGNLPLMVSAQCVKMNTTGCKKLGTKTLDKSADSQDEPLVLIDRLRNELTVRTNCRECYNTIFNSKCLSLLDEVKEIERLHPRNIRLDFTNESGDEVMNVLHSYADVFRHKKQASLSLREYTKGHFRRGIL